MKAFAIFKVFSNVCQEVIHITGKMKNSKGYHCLHYPHHINKGTVASSRELLPHQLRTRIVAVQAPATRSSLLLGKNVFCHELALTELHKCLTYYAKHSFS